MNNYLEYKGYVGSVLYKDEEELFYGRLEGISAVVTYEGFDFTTLKSAFHDAVDRFLTTPH